MKTMIDYRKEFYQIFHKEILPQLSMLEPERKARLRMYWTTEIILMAASSFFFVNFKIQSSYSYIYCFLGILCIIGTIAYGGIKSTVFRKLLKNRCMGNLTKVFGQMEWGTGDKEIINDANLIDSGLFSTFNRRQTDDEFAGNYNGVDFQISETIMGFESGSGKNKHYHQVFEGIIVNFKSNKKIKNRTIITTRGDKYVKNSIWSLLLSMLSILIYSVLLIIQKEWGIAAIWIFLGILSFCLIFHSDKKDEPLNEIKLEDPVFCKKFKAYSSDEVEARYLITTGFMERFTNMNTSFGAKRAKCSFYNNDIMFAISTNKNLFEIGDLFHRLNTPKKIETFFNEISSVLALVDYFKLNEHTGL